VSEEWVSMREAAARLKKEGYKISANKVSRLANRNVIRTKDDPLDARVKLVELGELRTLFASRLNGSNPDDDEGDEDDS
jgi:hypothetical protein